jgi:hemerythrin-like domain-containing protein
MTITKLLKKEHRAALRAVRRIRRQRPPQDARVEKAQSELSARLRAHLDVEEVLLYPAVRSCGDAAALGGLEEEHRRLRELVVDCARTRDATPLESKLLDHIRATETSAFPTAERDLAPAKLESLFYAADRLKSGQSARDSAIFPAHRFGS